jgi:hypothetical protein
MLAHRLGKDGIRVRDELTEFTAAIASVDRWLNRHAARPDLPASLRDAAAKLKRYVRRCQKYVEGKNVSSDEMMRRRLKLTRTAVALWNAEAKYFGR